MADGVFAVEVVTPEQRLVEGRAVAIVLRSSEGDLTVLDGHTTLITDVVPGEVRVDRPEGDSVRLAVHNGFLQVAREDAGASAGPIGEVGARPALSDTRVTVLAGVAELADQIDVERAEQARAAASAQVEELRAAGATSRPAPGAPAGPEPEAPATPLDRELARAEAALRRAEVRLEVAGVSTAGSPGAAGS